MSPLAARPSPLATLPTTATTDGIVPAQTGPFVSLIGVDASPRPEQGNGGAHFPAPVEPAHTTLQPAGFGRGEPAPELSIAAPLTGHAVARGDAFTAPAGSPEFEGLPFDERFELTLRLRILRSMHAADNKSEVARAELSRRAGQRGWSVKRLLNLYTVYTHGTGQYRPFDWRIAVNRRQAGGLWRSSLTGVGLPSEFIREAWHPLVIENKRKVAPAWRKLIQWWTSGYRRVNDRRVLAPVPGYGFWREWFRRTFPGEPEPFEAPIPKGWSRENLTKSYGLPKRELALAREGIAAARAFTPRVLGTRAGARFLERVFFDDVKTDFRVIDEQSGQVVDLWLLVAQDYATGAFLGFWMRPSLVDYKGKADHLRLDDMKKFAGWLLETYGLPADYACNWKVERGTATFTEACRQALGALFGDRLTVSYSSMIGGSSPAGFNERAVGNSAGKAPLESSFNLLHNENGDVSAQTGRRWEVRPADLIAREKEAAQIWQEFKGLDADLAKAVFPVMTLAQSRAVLNASFHRINTRTEHAIEGFETVWEWRAEATQPWQPIAGMPDPTPAEYQTRSRKQSPLERIMALIQGHRFDRIPAAALTVFYGTTQHAVAVGDDGQISFTQAGADYIFAPVVDTQQRLQVGTKLLAYFCPEDPRFVYLTRPAPHFGFVATWARRTRVGMRDRDGIAEQIRYCQASMAEAREVVAELNSGERARLDDMRTANAEVLEEVRANRGAIDATADSAVTVTERGMPVTVTTAVLSRSRAAVASAEQATRRQRQSDAELLDEVNAALSKGVS